MIALEAMLVRSPEVLSVDLDGETVILDAPSGNYYSLDDIGSDIWHRLAAPIRVAALTAALEQDYDGPPETIRADLLDLLGTLLERRLITAQPAD